MSFTRVSSALFLSLLLAACDGTPPISDAGVDAGLPDSGPPDAGPPLACTETMTVDGVLGDTVSVMFDTAMTETRPRDLGLTCGNAEAELRWAPEEVVELHVPGTGPVAVDLDTVSSGETDADFNTVLQVRTQCEHVPQGIFPPTCFDDFSQTDFRSRGSFMATGGQTYFIIVTGFSHPPADQGTVDRGHVRLDITVHDNAPPTITSGSLILAGNDTLVGAGGSDGLSGGSGDDTLDGGADPDTLDGAEGVDLIKARDGGADQLDCGSSTDTVIGDSFDLVPASCELVSAGVLIGDAKAKGKKVKLELTCPAAEGAACPVKAKLSFKGEKIAAGSGTIAAAQTKNLKLKLNKAGKQLLADHDKPKVDAKVTLTDASGAVVVSAGKVVVG
jgi:Ca2+-binding RTX toxin-like protein